MKFYTIYTKPIDEGQTFEKPSVTVPDESMSIQEIIARFTRTGSIPVKAFPSDDGGNVASEPDFDPLDFRPEDFMSPQRKSQEKAEKPQETPVSEPPADSPPET